MMKGFKGFGSLLVWFWRLKFGTLEPKFWVCEFWVLKGSETHEMGTPRKDGFLNICICIHWWFFCCRFVARFICLLFKFHGISETFQNLGLERVIHSSLFVKVLCGALLHNYVGDFVVTIKVERLGHMCVFWNHKQRLW
jgi:hypothetical protein